MNVIIIAACIPTLRPLFLILLRRSTPSDFLPSSRQNRHSYHKHPSSSDPGSGHVPTIGSQASKALSNANKAFDPYRNHTATGSTDSTQGLDTLRSNKNSILVSETICIESREVRSGSEDGSEDEREWGGAGGGRGRGQGVPLSEIGKPRQVRTDEITVVREDERQGVSGEDMV